jgi:hypothetical protein
MADSYSFLEAKQQLENEMADRQRWLVDILTGQYRYESSSAEKRGKELLENEIEDRKIALEKLDAQSSCDCCGMQVDVREAFRIRMTKYSEKLPTINLMMEKVRVTVECADCRRKYDSQQRCKQTQCTRSARSGTVGIWAGLLRISARCLQSLWPDPQWPQDRVNEQLAQQGPQRMIHARTSLARDKRSSLG